jgi:hypothetical protein
MLKSIKLPEKAYIDAKRLRKELEKEEIIEGVYDVKLSTAVGFAIKKTLEDIKNNKRFLSSAGGWSDMDCDKLIKEIYDNRAKGTRWDITLD